MKPFVARDSLMDLETFRQLLKAPGQAALDLAETLNPTPSSFPACVDRVAKIAGFALAKAAIETVLLRIKAREKFPQSDRLYVTREALEQASGHVIATYRAGRFLPGALVADLCCGIGGDSLALAATGRQVVAVEQSPLLAEMTSANAASLGLADRVVVKQGDALALPLEDVEAAFADPGRRAGDRRFLALADYLPPPDAIRARFPETFSLAFKLAPGISRRDLEPWDAEAEFISVDGELKECVLWCGPLQTAKRRATVLSTRSSQIESYATHEMAEPRAPSEPKDFVFDPDSSIIRAELEHDLAEQLDLHPLEDGIAFFTANAALPTPFGDWYEVEHSAKFHLGKLREYLRQHQVGRVTLLKRATSLDANEVMRKLKLGGSEHRHVILTRVQGESWVIVGKSRKA